LLDATFAAKGQANAALQEMTQNLKKATEDKKSSDMRYKYLAGVAKKEFGVTKSNKRKLTAESLTAAVFGNIHDFRPKKQRFDDFGEDDEKEYLVKEELPKEELLSNGIKLEEPRENQLRRSEPGLLGHDWKVVPIKHESPSRSETSIPTVYFVIKREVSLEPSLSDNIRPVNGNGDFQPRRSMSRLSDSKWGTNSRSFRNSLRSEDNTSLQQFEDLSSTAHSSATGSFKSTESYPTVRSILDKPKTAKHSTCSGRLGITFMNNSTQEDSYSLVNCSATSVSETLSPKVDRSFADLAEMTGLSYAVSNITASETNDTDLIGPAPAIITAGGSYAGDADGDESDNAASDMNSSGSIATKSNEGDAA
jgi:hypothetical protein